MREPWERGSRTANACGTWLAACMGAWLVMAWPLGPAVAQDVAPLAVRVQVARGPYYVGESIELDVNVVGRDQRPKVEVPAIKNADVWTVTTSFKPLSATGIGTSISVENLFVTRLRIMTRRAGLLEIPPIEARIDDRSGRSRQTRLSIQNPPPEGRPAEFLGGIGEFTVGAVATPASVRVGAELMYRINVSGSAAWGMTSRPDLSRFGRIAVSPRIEALPNQTVNEPPSRTFVYHVRPTRAGDVVLPPVSIAAFDPELARYVTKTTQGIPIKVVAVTAFNAQALDYTAPFPERGRTAARVWASAGALLLAFLAALPLAVLIHRRRVARGRSGPEAARRFSRRALRELRKLAYEKHVHYLCENPRDSGWVHYERTSPHLCQPAARQITEALIEYARVGVRRPAGALTPDEARDVVAGLTRSQAMGDRAAVVLGRCDLALFAADTDLCDAKELIESARELFEALGQVSTAELDFSAQPDRATA
jgi:BatD DUF11 like domain